MKRTKYRPLFVTVELAEERRGSWAWQGRKIKGTEYLYQALDENFDRLNKWLFSVRVPNKPGQILVQAQTVPGKKVFAQVGRRAITFQQATKRPYRKHAYCKVHLADPSMEKNWRGTTRGDKSKLPEWFRYFSSRIRLKEAVATTAGNDGWDLVALIAPDDHKRMIRLYFAMRVWVLQENFILE